MPESDNAAAREVLGKAISAYFAETHPGSYVDGWVLVTQRRSVELERNGQTVIGSVVPEQSWALTRGLLDIALEAEREEQKAMESDTDG